MEPIKQSFHEVRIEQASNGGYIMRVGCKTFICPQEDAKINALCSDLAAYLKDPERTQKQYEAREREIWEAQTALTCEIPASVPENRYSR